MREQFRSLIEDLSPDVIHAHFGPSGVLMGPVSQKKDVPLVVTFYGYDVSRLAQKAFWKERYNDLWEQADRVTVLSEKMKAEVERMGCPLSKVKIVHLSRDLDQFPFREPEGPVNNILFVGRLTPKKAPLDAVRAVQTANKKGADLTLEMVGDGPMYEEVETYVDEQNLVGDVKMHGRLSNADVAQRMQKADAFLLPSKTAPSGDREGTPTVLVEAQATGLPCVTTRHAGIPEMIPMENHDLLSPEGDIESLARCLGKLSSSSINEFVKKAEKGRKKMEKDFEVSKEANKIAKTYGEIVNK
ncbi:glycosyltransferase involved in cell wall biosynthesis [Salinibacter ruber]|nr:glycosyltransferase involved in cell wall biosynthesis [Salinibacter ruber]